MPELSKIFTEDWNLETEKGPFFDIEIEIEAARTDAVEKAQEFLKSHGYTSDLSAKINLKRLQPHHTELKPQIRKYILSAKTIPENVLGLLYDMDQMAKEHTGKTLFLMVIEHPLERAKSDLYDTLNNEPGGYLALPPPDGWTPPGQD